MKSTDNKIKDVYDKISVASLMIGLLALLISLMFSALPYNAELSSKLQLERRTMQALNEELDRNAGEARLIIKQHKEHGRIVAPPAYLTVAYESAVSNGHLYLLTNNTPQKVHTAYAGIKQFEAVFLSNTLDSNDSIQALLHTFAENNLANLNAARENYEFNLQTEEESNTALLLIKFSVVQLALLCVIVGMSIWKPAHSRIFQKITRLDTNLLVKRLLDVLRRIIPVGKR